MEDIEKAQLGQSRLSFLRMVNKLLGTEATFYMVGNIEVKGKFASIDRDMKNIYVTDLKTNTGTYKSALLRTSDIVSISISAEESLLS